MLYKRGKNWYARVQYKNKIVTRSTGTSDRRAAAQFEKRLREELWRAVENTGHTFDQAALRWLEEKAHKRSLGTDAMILKWFAKYLEGSQLSEITRYRIEELRAIRRSECSTETVNRYFALLRSLLNTAYEDWEWLKTKPPKVPMFPKRQRAPRFLSWGQFARLAECLPSHLSSPAWFAVSTGLRTQAIQSLRWDWISRDGVRFPASVMKNAESLKIPLSQTAWYVIAERFAESRNLNGLAKGLVFVTDVGKPWAGKFTNSAWRKACARAGLTGVTFHDLRHTWASWKLQEGTPEHVVMALGGWKSRDAMKIYARFSPASLQEWV